MTKCGAVLSQIQEDEQNESNKDENETKIELSVYEDKEICFSRKIPKIVVTDNQLSARMNKKELFHINLNALIRDGGYFRICSKKQKVIVKMIQLLS